MAVGLSNTDAIKLALIPGQAEILHSWAESQGNMVWSGLAKSIQIARNLLYVGIALTVIASIGIGFVSTALPLSLGVIVLTGCVGLSVLAARRLYVITSTIQQIRRFKFEVH